MTSQERAATLSAAEPAEEIAAVEPAPSTSSPDTVRQYTWLP